MLPEGGEQQEEGGNAGGREADLRHRARREGFHFMLGAMRVGFFVPAGKSGKEEKDQSGEEERNKSVTYIQ